MHLVKLYRTSKVDAEKVYQFYGKFIKSGAGFKDEEKNVGLT